MKIHMHMNFKILRKKSFNLKKSKILRKKSIVWVRIEVSLENREFRSWILHLCAVT
jgi:hypothetical protein